ncbi:hypothetical protein V6Z11_A08G128800 [Gossypium hirsutum]
MRLYPSWLMAREQRKQEEPSLGPISTPKKGSPMIETAGTTFAGT